MVSLLPSDHYSTSSELSGINIDEVKMASTLLKSSSYFHDYQTKVCAFLTLCSYCSCTDISLALQIIHCLQNRLFPTLIADPLDLECIRLYVSLPLFIMIYMCNHDNYKILWTYSIAFLSLSSSAKNFIGKL